MPHRVFIETADEHHLLRAAERLRALGYRRLDAHTPFPVPGLAAAVGLPSTRMPLSLLIGAVLGGGGGYLVQWWCTAVDYPIRSGGFPVHPILAFLPITFESAVIGSCLLGTAAVLLANGLPQWWHPVFELQDATSISTDRFVLEVADPEADADRIAHALSPEPPLAIQRVDWP